MSRKRKSGDTSPQRAAVTLAGTVDKIIPPITPAQVEKVQISVKTDEHLYREIRIENALHDEAGNTVTLKEGSEVEVTVEADQKSTAKKDISIKSKAAAAGKNILGEY